MDASMSQHGNAEEWRGTGSSALGIGAQDLLSLVAAAVSEITFAAALEMYRMLSVGMPLRRVKSEVYTGARDLAMTGVEIEAVTMKPVACSRVSFWTNLGEANASRMEAYLSAFPWGSTMEHREVGPATKKSQPMY